MVLELWIKTMWNFIYKRILRVVMLKRIQVYFLSTSTGIVSTISHGWFFTFLILSLVWHSLWFFWRDCLQGNGKWMLKWRKSNRNLFLRFFWTGQRIERFYQLLVKDAIKVNLFMITIKYWAFKSLSHWIGKGSQNSVWNYPCFFA